MRKIFGAVALLALSSSAFAQAVPNNINVECQFRGPASKKAPRMRCHAVANFHFQGDPENMAEPEDHFLVNCPGLGQDTVVYNDAGEYVANGAIVINPEGPDTFPAVTLPSTAFACSQTPTRWNANLVLPERAPYNSRTLSGRCQVVTAGCSGSGVELE